MEVSSPGVDEPLTLVRQYKKNIGRNIEIIFNDETKTEGKLIAAPILILLLKQHKAKAKKQ